MKPIKTLGAVTLVMTAFSATQALALDTVYSPHVVKGEMEMEYYGSRTIDGDASKNNAQSHEIEIEYGLTDHFKAKLAGEYEREAEGRKRFTKVEVGGQYQFGEQGEYWLDSGLLLAYGMSTENRSPNTLEAKLLLEKQFGKFLNRANIGLEQEVGHYASGGPERSILWSTRYRYSNYIEPGFEIQSNFGKGSDTERFNDQEHYVGPAVYGQLMPGLKYEAAYYKGISDATANSAVRVFLEYEIYF